MKGMLAMKKNLLVIVSLLVLAGCGGNEFGLDEEKVNNAISNAALEQKVIEDGGYEGEDIEVYKVCKVIENGKEDLGFQDIYRAYWKTSDEKHSDKYILEDYTAGYGNNNYSDMEDSCIDWN